MRRPGALTVVLFLLSAGCSDNNSSTTGAPTTEAVDSSTETPTTTVVTTDAPPIASTIAGPGVAINLDVGVCEGGHSPTLFAVDKTSGALEWAYCPAEATTFEVVAATAEVVYAKAFTRRPPSGGLYEAVAVSATTGGELWRREVSPQPWAPGSFAGGGIVAIAVGGTESTGAESIIGVDATTGEEHWHVDANGMLPIAHTEDIVVIGALEGLRGLDRQTGQERWTTSDGLSDQSGNGVGRAATAAFGDTLVLPTLRGLVALDTTNGKELWRAPQLDHPSSMGDTVVGGVQGIVTAVDTKTGAELWHAPGSPSYGDVWAIGDSSVFVRDEMGGIIAYDLRTGAPRWALPGQLSQGAEPWATADGSFYAGWERIVISFSAADGKPQWTLIPSLAGRAWMTALTTNGRSAIISVNDFAPTD